MYVQATDRAIAGLVHTIGDGTSSGAALFDGNYNQALSASSRKGSATFMYAGASLSPAKAITRAIVFGSNDQGYVNSINPTVTLDLYGKTGAAPGSSTDGTLLGTLSFTDTANESGNPRNIAATVSGTWDHVWIRVSHNGASNTIAVAELIVFETWEPDLEEGASENNPLFGYDNVVTVDNITATSEDADFPVTNLANVSTALKWVATSTAVQLVTIDVSGLGAIDYLAVAKHNFGTAAASLAVLGRTGTNALTIIASATAPDDDAPVVFRFPPQALDDIALFTNTAALPVEAAVLYVGQLIAMQQGIQSEHVPLSRANMLDVVNGRSESGNFLGRIITGSKLASTASFANLDEDWFLANIYPIVLQGFQEPFFWVWRPEDQPDETAFAWMVNDPQASRDLEGTIAFDFDMVGIA